MASPLSPEKRARLERDLKRRKDKPSVREYANKHGVSTATVIRYAKASGIDFGETKRLATENAIKAKRLDSKARLETIKQRIIDEAIVSLDSLNEPCLVYSFGGRDNDYNEHILERPTHAERRIILTTVAIAVDKVAVIEKQSTGGGQSALSQFGAFLAQLSDPVGEYDPAGVS